MNHPYFLQMLLLYALFYKISPTQNCFHGCDHPPPLLPSICFTLAPTPTTLKILGLYLKPTPSCLRNYTTTFPPLQFPPISITQQQYFNQSKSMEVTPDAKDYFCLSTLPQPLRLNILFGPLRVIEEKSQSQSISLIISRRKMISILMSEVIEKQ